MLGFLEKFRGHEPKMPPPPPQEIKKPKPEEPELTNKELEEILETRPKVSGGKLDGDNMNDVFIYGIQDDGRGVFKPQSGESGNLVGNVKPGTYFKRERAAYLISDFLNLDLVPPTVIRVFDGEVGSFQHFVQNHRMGYEISYEEEKQFGQEFVKLWIFDYIIWSFERHWGNYLFRRGGKVVAIDNGLSLKDKIERPFESRVSRGEAVGKLLEPELVENFKKTAENSAKLEELRESISKLIGDAAAGACISRIKNIAKVIAAEGCVPEDFVPRFSFE